MESVRNLGVVGGTFDPPHLAHLVVAAQSVAAFDLDLMLFVPAGQPWQKGDYSDAEHRYLMTALAAALHPRFAVSRIEIDRKGPTYTVQTLDAMRGFYGPEVRIFFVMGADASALVHTWHEAPRLGELAELVSVRRPGYPPVASAGFSIHQLDVPGLDISSTDIRARVRSGKPIDFLVPMEVERYIREHGLYQGTREAVGA